MPNKMQRFTQRAQHILSLAQEEAERRNHNYIGTERLLLGIMREEGGIGGRVLIDLGLDVNRVQELVERLTRAGQRSANERLDLSPGMKKVLELAVDESRRMGHHYIGTEHLLLGLTRQSEGIAIDVLKRLNVSPEEVRRQTRRRLQESPVQARAANEHISVQPATEPVTSPPAPAPTQPEVIKTPVLDQITTDLTLDALAGKLDPVTGRDAEIERLIEFLCRRKNNNATLLGDAGVGKSSIVEGLAQRISQGIAPDALLNKRIKLLDVGSLVNIVRKPVFTDLVRLVGELNASNSILFIDQLALIVGPPPKHWQADLRILLQTVIDRMHLSIIGEMLPAEFDAWKTADPVLARRFQPLHIDEPSLEATLQMLQSSRSQYEVFHHIVITQEAIRAVGRLSAKFVADRGALPGKAFDLLDETASQLRRVSQPGQRGPLERELGQVILQQQAPALTDEQRQALHQREQALLAELGIALTQVEKTTNPASLTAQHVAEVVVRWTGRPLEEVLIEIGADR